METAAQIITAITAQLAQAAQLSAVAEEVGAEIARLQGVGSSEEGEVTVTVDHHGIPLDITVHDEALAYDGAQVSAMVLDATQRAIQDVQEKAEPLRLALLQPHTATPMREDLGDRIQELYDRIEEYERGTASGQDAAADDAKGDQP
ncbi:YbaB/EbfC family nucleoid-associated protein [Microbacterium sp. Clip185]|uniref:YbaB/EbfC family nucleoid-associated protein n=1 Tax=Microbacterium sp. Clip185 TaxID=3025663 RepID=UPI00236534E8|nr:YbaB/EbfC family nucleoid-associated protein [Microbacterium sp. Clip185]WDG18473.1 YbaB/EbfC family nucleoid-associated protein [Microbacterium sp. Clip185]